MEEKTYGTLIVYLKGQTPVSLDGVEKEIAEGTHSMFKHFIKYKGKKNDRYSCVTFDKGIYAFSLEEVQMLYWLQDN